MQPVTCAAAAVDVPLPPRPKETQRHLALTQLQKSHRRKLRLRGRASAPESRRGRARALTSRRERSKWSGKSLATSFGTARAPQEAAATAITVITSPSLPLQQPPPDGSGPARCCSMRSSPANPDAPGRHPRAPIGCRRRLCLSPFLARSTQGRAAGYEDGNRHFGGKGPESEIRDRCVLLVGRRVGGYDPFYSLACPLRLEKPALPPPPRLITATQTNSRSPAPSTLSRGGKSFPAAVAAAIFPEREAVTLSGRRGPSRRASLSWGEAAEGP